MKTDQTIQLHKSPVQTVPSNLFVIRLWLQFNDGDEVIVPAPYWVSYPELIKLADGKPVFVEGDEKSNYKFTKENLENVVSDKTKAIVLNTPNNPTGTIYNKEELEVIADFAKKYNIIVLHDNAYSELVFDGKSCGSFLRFPGGQGSGGGI